MFYGLLPEPHNAEICKVLLAALEFHSLAKLRLHTNHTLTDLDTATTTYGRAIRCFATHTCPAFRTKDTPREAEARARRRAKKDKCAKDAVGSAQGAESSAWTFSLSRFKLYALGYYPATIRTFGTTKSYSALRVCAHSFKRASYSFM